MLQTQLQASVPKEGMSMLSACITMPWHWLTQLSLRPYSTTRTTADRKQLLTGPVGICSSWRYAAALQLKPQASACLCHTTEVWFCVPVLLFHTACLGACCVKCITLYAHSCDLRTKCLCTMCLSRRRASMLLWLQFTLTPSSNWPLPNLRFLYLCQSLQAAFEQVEQEPPTEPGEGAGLYSCEHHQLSAIQVGMLCVTLSFLLRFGLPPPLPQSSPCWLCFLVPLLATSRPVPFILSSSQRQGPALQQSFASTKVITAFPQPVPSSLCCYPTNFLDLPDVALILHDQFGDAIGADDNARTHLSIVWDLGVWLCA